MIQGLTEKLKASPLAKATLGGTAGGDFSYAFPLNIKGQEHPVNPEKD